MQNKWKMLRKDEKGMFTIEASLVFPIIFITTIALILFSLVIYEKVVIYQKAQLIAERTSFTWDNSYKDFDTGEFPINAYTTMDNGDGLYWRTNFIGKQFIEKVFPNRLKGAGDDKIERARTEGSAMFTSGDVQIEEPSALGFDRRVKVTVNGNLKLPDFVDLLADQEFTAKTSASIKDPVELIRTTDFIVHYGKEVMGSITSN
ncbi:hypothetical protein GI584_08695 [Gracilibacillus salitolerans]|uniref:TadE-like protein n=1 Tax=Gracilibacillus salitolerans TaxID=2663022 RepID=A0A5Q2TJ76_9BACI|nr:hypothetical protein GI584_08695 [Gracilibacillus salitolerans]